MAIIYVSFMAVVSIEQNCMRKLEHTESKLRVGMNNPPMYSSV